MSRLIPAAGVLAVLLGAALLLRSAGDVAAAPSPPPSVTATASAPPAPTTAGSSPTPLPPIPVGYRIQIPRLGIDLEILEGDIERDSVQLQTPENYAFHLPGTAIPAAGGLSAY